jgi:CO/xanthine dehydrogenase Mo-binding subunit
MIPPTLAANPSLDRWVRFGADGTVAILFGKVEYGQGNMTALAQIGAEELGVAWERVHVEEPSTTNGPDEGLTVGSMSVETSGAAVRAACAEVRGILVDHAARLIGCDPIELTVEDGEIARDGCITGYTYWTLIAEVDLKRSPSEIVATRNPAEYKIVGQSLPRRDLPPKVFGSAFAHDFVPEGTLHARVLRQPSRRAKLVSLNEAAIRKAAGEDIEIFREGEFVAFLSLSEAAASRALAGAIETAVWDGLVERKAHDGRAETLRALPNEVFETGAPPAGPSNRRRITATYSKPYISHGSLGPSCAVAQWTDGLLTVWAHAQSVFPLRATLASGLGLAADAIVVHHRQGPGNYGHNGSDDAAFDAALLALRHEGVPIRVQWRREDEFASAPVGTAMLIELSAELDAAGRIADYTAEIWSGPHTNRGRAIAETALPERPRAETAPAGPGPGMMRGGFRFSGAVLNATPPYAIEATRVREHFIQRPPLRTSSLRGLGGPPNEFASECFIDELAETAGADPLDYRLQMMSDPRQRNVLTRAAELADWSRRGASGTGSGMGLAFCVHRNRGALVSIVAKVAAEREVRVQKVWCVVDAGLIINPDGARNQLEGGIVMATSWALKEEVKVDEKGISSATWGSYPILRFSEVPEVEIELVQAPERPAMGLGEISSGPTLAAIGNAVAHALGVRIRDLPLTRERVAAALLG